MVIFALTKIKFSFFFRTIFQLLLQLPYIKNREKDGYYYNIDLLCFLFVCIDPYFHLISFPFYLKDCFAFF